MNRLLLAVVGSLVLVGTASAQGVGFLKGESTNGLSKICVFDGPRGRTALTVESWQLCPLQMDTTIQTPMPMPTPRPSSGLDPWIILSQPGVPPYVSPFAAMAAARASQEDSVLRQQQIAINRQQLGPCPDVLAPGEHWVPSVINPFSKQAPALRRQRAAQRHRAEQALIGCAPAVVETPDQPTTTALQASDAAVTAAMEHYELTRAADTIKLQKDIIESQAITIRLLTDRLERAEARAR